MMETRVSALATFKTELVDDEVSEHADWSHIKKKINKVLTHDSKKSCNLIL